MSAVKHFIENLDGYDYVVGDIHGCFDKLQVKLQEIGFNEKEDRLFSVGDLVDRGPTSEEAYDWIAKPWFHAVRGNHEQMAIDYMKGWGDSNTYHMNGGKWFLDLSRDQRQLFADEFSFLPIAIEVDTPLGKVGIIHAECPTKSWKDLEGSLLGRNAQAFENICLWSREKINRGDNDSVEDIWRVYVGHTPLDSPGRLGNVFYIDTGACFKGKMTVFNITTGEEA